MALSFTGESASFRAKCFMTEIQNTTAMTTNTEALVNMTSGQRLVQARKMADMSQEDLARRTWISLDHICKWESDEWNLADAAFRMVYCIANVLSVSPAWLIAGIDDMPLADTVEDANRAAVSALRERDHTVAACAAIYYDESTAYMRKLNDTRAFKSQATRKADRLCEHAADMMEQIMTPDECIVYETIRNNKTREWGTAGDGIRRWYAATMATLVYHIADEAEIDRLDDEFADYTVLDDLPDGRSIIRIGRESEPSLYDLVMA